MARGHGLLMGLAACNSVYGLEPTHLQDGRSIDAPARCVTSGSLQFAPQARQVVIRDCADYTIVGERAFAYCNRNNQNIRSFAEGPVGGTLTDVKVTPTLEGNLVIAPRLLSDDELLVSQAISLEAGGSLSLYKRGEAGWMWNRDLPFVIGSLEYAGVMSRGPNRHMLITRATHVEEVIEDGDAWTSKQQSLASIGVTNVRGPMHLSADGLRTVFRDGDTMRFAVRASIGEPFPVASRLDIPPVDDAFMTEDCSRIYFSGLEAIFYVQR